MAAKLKHLMLATLENTSDPLAWSGSAMAVRRSLEGAVERLTVLDHLPVKKNPAHAVLRLALGGKPARYPLWMTKPALEDFARVTAQALDEHKPQALFVISTQCLVYLDRFYKGPAIPVFTFSDSAWMAWLEVYRGYYRWPVGARRFAAREREAARRATGIIYGSEWAKQDAVRRFGVQPNQVHVQPMGASWVPGAELYEAAIEAAVRARAATPIQLLYIAKEWERKGGPLAVEITRGLRAAGVDARLNVVGVRPELTPAEAECVQLFGMLRRSDAGEAARLRELLLQSHFLVVPTVAECFGLVFAEAQAFALPPVSRSVDAVPSIVVDGETGLLQAKEDGPEPYVQRMLALLARDREPYVQMALAGRKRFLARLNWGAFGRGVVRIVEGALA